MTSFITIKSMALADQRDFTTCDTRYPMSVQLFRKSCTLIGYDVSHVVKSRDLPCQNHRGILLQAAGAVTWRADRAVQSSVHQYSFCFGCRPDSHRCAYRALIKSRNGASCAVEALLGALVHRGKGGLCGHVTKLRFRAH